MGIATSADSLIAAGAKHFVYTSVYGSDLNNPNRFIQIKATCEKALKQSGMTWTILNPDPFLEVWAGLVIGIPLQAGRPVTLIGPTVGEVFNGMETYESFIDMSGTSSLYGVELTPLTHVMQQMFGQEMKVH